MQTKIAENLFLFYDHNGPLIFFGGMAFLSIFLAFVKNTKFFLVLFVAFSILAFRFEYTKHIFQKIEADMLNPMFPPSTRFTKYSIAQLFLKVYLPILMDIFAWGLIALTLIVGSPKKQKS